MGHGQGKVFRLPIPEKIQYQGVSGERHGFNLHEAAMSLQTLEDNRMPELHSEYGVGNAGGYSKQGFEG